MFGRLRRKTREIADQRLGELLSLSTSAGQPNLHQLRLIANAIEPLSLNIKQMGYGLARELAAALPPPGPSRPRRMNLPNSLSTQAAIESDWVAHWCNELRIPVVFHRKIWELCFVLQALYDGGHIRPGARGLGFGCGTEPIPSYLAAHGVSVTATDQSPVCAAGTGWIETGQYASAESAFMPHLVGRPDFDRHVALRVVDMNAIPDDLRGFDFCWSICALEHLGSIDHGLRFIENSLATLRPGGLSVHTTEFNIRDDGPTIDHWPSVAFQRRHIERLAARLRAQGHRVRPFDFALGDKPLDRFIDLPPFHNDLPDNIGDLLGPIAHLKVAFESAVVTCIGLAIERGED
ncbi:SAM-dependent methyltransferase [Sphingomonas crusticola]|uniref:SAM-dependent methyltransferase n=1 Tax=Sphingomonas crusticola TaxID=1697973 RepID=UPI000E2299A6|nr:methyltransferase domain-containing protein [Sphingomonas crusticola]